MNGTGGLVIDQVVGMIPLDDFRLLAMDIHTEQYTSFDTIRYLEFLLNQFNGEKGFYSCLKQDVPLIVVTLLWFILFLFTGSINVKNYINSVISVIKWQQCYQMVLSTVLSTVLSNGNSVSYICLGTAESHLKFHLSLGYTTITKLRQTKV